VKFFIVCPGGLEGVLQQELESIAKRSEVKNLGSIQVDPKPANFTGGISVDGPIALAMAINLHSRVASRVLLKLAGETYQTEDDLYRIAKRLGWEDWFQINQTLRVDITAQRSPLKSLNFATLKVKDAIADRLREKSGERPNIDTVNPDIRVQVHLTNQHATIYLDTSGEALFKRGWREEKGEAPLKENLAAGILMLSNWKVDEPLYDPMCGSGTFLIEAAQITLRIPPGALRAKILDPLEQQKNQVWKSHVIDTGFGFMRLKPFQTNLEKKNWQALCEIAKQEMKEHITRPLQISGSDIQEKMVAICKSNWQRARLPGLPVVRQIDAIQVRPPVNCPSNQPGIMIFNPPYGERLSIKGGDQDRPILFNQGNSSYMQKRRTSREPLVKEPIDSKFATLLDQFSKQLKDYFGGWEVFVLTADMGFPGHLRMKESKRTPLFNGPLECRLFKFEIRKKEVSQRS
jgi:putative N6-adenine-specific DNA methylase